MHIRSKFRPVRGVIVAVIVLLKCLSIISVLGLRLLRGRNLFTDSAKFAVHVATVEQHLALGSSHGLSPANAGKFFTILVLFLLLSEIFLDSLHELFIFTHLFKALFALL